MVLILAVCFNAFLVSAHAVESGGMLTKEQVERALLEYVLERGPWRPERIEVKVGSFKPLRLPSGQIHLRVLKAGKEVTPGSHTFLLAVELGKGEEARVWVRAEVKIFDDVVVTSSPIAHYEIITAEHVRLERREIPSLSVRSFTRIEDAVGKQASRVIEVNEILTPSLVDWPRVVRRGSSIHMVYETPLLRVEVPGQAEEGGKVGDRIQVKNLSSGKMLRAVVLDDRTVRVD